MTHIREQIQERLDDDGDEYILKTNDELIDVICNFGCGETEFHTADIERLLREISFLKEREEGLVARVKELMDKYETEEK